MWQLLSITFLAILADKCLSNKVLIVSLDGFRYDMLEIISAAGGDVTGFERIRNAGFQGEVENVFPTNTFPTHFAIATGRTVESHGLVNNAFYDPIMNETYSYKNADDQLNPIWLEYGLNEPIWLTNQRNGNLSCVFYWPGSNAAFYDKYPFSTFGLYADTPSLPYRIDRVIEWLNKDEFTFCTLYFNQPDSVGHALGPSSKEYKEMIVQISSSINYLLDKIESEPSLKGKLNLIVTSDHGMVDVPVENRIHMYKIVTTEEYIPNSSPGIVGIWPKPGVETKTIYEKLVKANMTNASVYLKHEIPEYFHYSKSNRIPPIIVLADPGYLIMMSNTSFLINPPKGMHGYSNQYKSMHPIFLACGPDIKKLTGIQQLKQIDIYAYITGLLGIDKPNKIDGRLDRMTKYMNHPPSAEFMSTWIKYATGISIP